MQQHAPQLYKKVEKLCPAVAARLDCLQSSFEYQKFLEHSTATTFTVIYFTRERERERERERLFLIPLVLLNVGNPPVYFPYTGLRTRCRYCNFRPHFSRLTLTSNQPLSPSSFESYELSTKQFPNNTYVGARLC